MSKHVAFMLLIFTQVMTLVGVVGLFVENSALRETVLQLETEKKECVETVTAKHKMVDEVTEFIMDKRKSIHPQVAKEWAREFIASGEEFGLDPYLLVHVSIVESGIYQVGPYGYTLRSHAGAEGIMQVMPTYWGNGEIPFVKSRRNLRHPIINIRAGAYILNKYMKECGGLLAGLRCYHGGPKSLTSPRASTIAYSTKILANYNAMRI